MVAQPRARALQPEADERDDALTARARTSVLGVKHWWGRRWIHDRNGAWCYLCWRMVVSWPRNQEMPEVARAAVHDHRIWHISVRGDHLTHPSGVER